MFKIAILQAVLFFGCSICLCTARLPDLDVYPWGNHNFDDYNENLLETLREKVHLNVWETTISSFDPPISKNEWIIMNSEANPFVLKDIVTTNSLAMLSIGEISELLQKNCAILVHGFWSYQWCHT
jgi:hypothetical protein